MIRRHNAVIRPAEAEHVETIPADLAAITEAVRAGDPEAARRLMREHLDGWNRRNRGTLSER